MMAIKKLLSEFAILLPVLLACLCFTRTAFGQRPAVVPVRQLTVVDSHGKVLGHVMGGLGVGILLEPWLPVFLKLDDRLVRVNVAKDRLAAGALYFDLPLCQGIPQIYVSSNTAEPLVTPTAIGLPGYTIYVPQPEAVSQLKTIESYHDGIGCNRYHAALHLRPAEPLLDLGTVFTPPFSLRTIP